MPFSTTTAKLVGATHWLDHDQTVATWAKRAPALAYPAILAANVGMGLAEAPPEERPKTLAKEVIQLGLPTVATLWATHKFMQPEISPIALTKSAAGFVEKTYPGLLAWADKTTAETLQATPKVLQRLYWGSAKNNEALAKALEQPFSHRLKHTPEQVLDVETHHFIQGLRERFQQQAANLKPEQLTERWQNLTQAAEQFVVENAARLKVPPPANVLQQGYNGLKHWAEAEQAELPLLHWPTYLREQGETLLAKAGHIKPAWLLKQELRLALPIEDDFSTPKHLFNSSVGSAIKHAVGDTLHDIKEEALPFFATGGVSIASGIGSGLLANHLFNAPKSKDVDVVKEGVFQFVANVGMCALGAASGMGVANLFGLSKFKAPIPRFLTISSGLAGGIVLGAKSAKGLSERLVEPVAKRIWGDEADSEKGRNINAADLALHMDDVPMAMALAGLNILKAFIPMFFFLSGVKAAEGYRNEDTDPIEPLEQHALHHSANHQQSAATFVNPPLDTAIQTSTQPSGYASMVAAPALPVTPSPSRPAPSPLHFSSLMVSSSRFQAQPPQALTLNPWLSAPLPTSSQQTPPQVYGQY